MSEVEGVRQVAWWLEEGEDQCPHCLVFYRIEVGAWCAACDGPLCPSCLTRVRVEREVLCPDCAAGTDAEEDA